MGFESVEAFAVVLRCGAVDGQRGGAMLQLPVVAGSGGAAGREVLPQLRGQRRPEESLNCLEAPLASSNSSILVPAQRFPFQIPLGQQR